MSDGSFHPGEVQLLTILIPLRYFNRAMGDETTINDVILLCMSITFGRYIDALNERGHKEFDNTNTVKVLLPIGNPIRPSHYGDYYEGLCNRMTPIVIPLNIPRSSKDASSFANSAIKQISAYMHKAKRSNTPTLMTVLNTLLSPLLSLDTIKDAAKHAFDCVSCVYSNVPGPSEAISLKGATRSYQITKMHVIMPHPVSIVNILSYNSSVFFNITLDTRAAEEPWRLRNAFVEAVESVAEAAGVKSKWEKELDSLKTTTEWGGNGVVYLCGPDDKEFSVEGKVLDDNSGSVMAQ